MTEGDAVDAVPRHVWLSAVGEQFCRNLAEIPQEDNKTARVFVAAVKDSTEIARNDADFRTRSQILWVADQRVEKRLYLPVERLELC